MKKEYITINRKEVSIKLQASDINSIRVKDIERNAVRVFDKGFIGISGAVGASTVEELTEQATANLASKIPYRYELESNHKDHRDYTKKVFSEKDLLNLTETILNSYKQDYNNFIFSESIKTIGIDYKLHNTEGLDLRYQDQRLELGFIVKAKSSSNLFDTFLQWQGRDMDVEKFLTFTKGLLEAESTNVDLPEGDKVPVFFLSPDSMGFYLMQQLNGETYGNKASKFNGKIGEKLFNDKLTAIQNKDPETSYSIFFDTEGVTHENDTVTFIENGVLKRVFTDKKSAKKFKLEHTGSATGEYDDKPTIGFINLEFLEDSKDIQKILNGKPAIFVMVSSGGEVNADGNYATPVQAAYLFDGKNFLGKLPDFNMNNSVFNMLGDDYIGTFKSKDLYFGEHHLTFGCYMNIVK